jgi:cell division protein FtsL
MPVTITSWTDYYRGRAIFSTVETVLYVLIVIDFIVASGIYIFKVNKKKKNT